MALEDRIKEARRAANLTQLQAATKIGVAKSTWAGYESGNSTPDIDKLVKIMDALSVDANYLWQDYNQEETKKSPAPEGAEDEDIISMEQSNRLFDALVAAGLIVDDDLAAEDIHFLGHICDLIGDWFARKHRK